MIIFDKNQKKNKKKYKINFYKYYFFITTSLAIFLIIFFMNSGIWQMYKKKIFDRLEIYGFNNYRHLPLILVKSFKGFFADPEKIYLDLSYEQVLKLERNRLEKKELQKGFYFPYEKGGGYPFDFKWSRGSIKINDGKKKKIKIRIKGARSIHWKDEKYSSYRIRVRKNEKIKGTDVFSLQKPRARNYLQEWIFHKLLNELELISINYEFVKLIKNGESKGIYAFEESFSNEIIERNKRRNGPIFSLDEQYSVNQKNSFVEVYDEKLWGNLNITKIASKKIEEIFKDNIEIENAINIDDWAKYFAIIDLTQTYHGLLPKSVKFYYNPISGLFEPIGFDGHYFALSKIDGSKINENQGRYYDLLIDLLLKKNNLGYQNNFINVFLKNEIFREKYIEYLYKVSKKEFLDVFFEKYQKEIEKNLSLIYSDYFLNDHAFFYGPGIYYFDKKEYYNRADEINKKLAIYKERIKVISNNDILNIYNLNLNTNIRPVSIKCDKKITNLNNTMYFNNSFIKIKDFSFGNCQTIKFINILENKYINLKINHYNNQNFTLQYLKNYSEEIPKYFNKVNNELYLKKEKIIVDKNIFIPKKYTLVLLEGQEIEITNNSFIFSKANWITKNLSSDKNRIKIYGDKNKPGGGLIIFDNEKKTVLKNVDFFNLGSFTKLSKKSSDINNITSYFNLLGAINFYKTNLNISECKFYNIIAEDALNIISSNFEIKNSDFNNLKYDAIDFDFAEGSIKNIEFFEIGNDAIDFSGSNAKVVNINGKKIKDKVISVGENSKISAKEIIAEDALIGIASKDSSLVIAENTKFNNIDYPFASYRKKKEFQGSKIFIQKNFSKNFIKKYLKDDSSIIKIDGKFQNDINKDILKLIYINT